MSPCELQVEIPVNNSPPISKMSVPDNEATSPPVSIIRSAKGLRRRNGRGDEEKGRSVTASSQPADDLAVSSGLPFPSLAESEATAFSAFAQRSFFPRSVQRSL